MTSAIIYLLYLFIFLYIPIYYNWTHWYRIVFTYGEIKEITLSSPNEYVTYVNMISSNMKNRNQTKSGSEASLKYQLSGCVADKPALCCLISCVSSYCLFPLMWPR